MFEIENGFQSCVSEYGRKGAVEVTLDIHKYTKLHDPKISTGEPDLNGHQLFDFNEHFIELGSPVGRRSMDFMFLIILVFGVSAIGYFFVDLIFKKLFDPIKDAPPIWLILEAGVVLAFVVFLFNFSWRAVLRPAFFTALTARYRFNRTTGKIYVVRPKKFGGNAVLDWNRVKAHPSWCAAGTLNPGFHHNPDLREERQNNGGGFFMMRGLLLYWPPFDAKDPERKGEDFFLVGTWLSGEGLWEYIRRFMEYGMDSVPAPQPDEYRRKGRSSMIQHLYEDLFDPFVREAKRDGNPEPESAIPGAYALGQVLTLPFNSLAQWLCYWPTFPKEWNSDCGQRQREKGIGVEAPLRWTAKI
jgi:hypothetical protein